MTARRVVLVVLTLLAAPAAWAVAGMGTAIAGEGAKALYAQVEAWRNELKEESNSDANRAKLFRNLKSASDQLRPMREETRKTIEYLQDQQAKLKGQYGDQPIGDWKAADRETFQKNQTALTQIQGAGKHIDDAWEDLKWLVGRQGVPGFNPFINPEFKDRMKRLGERLQAAGKGFDEFNNTYSVDTGKDAGVGTAAFVKISCANKDMQFEVNGKKVGGDAPAADTARLNVGRAISIKVLAMDEHRKRLIATAKRLESGEMKTVQVRDKDVPYWLHYGTDKLATWLRAESEGYEWSWGSQMLACIGKSSPWSPDPTIIPEPKLSSSRQQSKNDLMTWVVPASDEEREFTMDVIATVRWTIGRATDGQQPKVTEESKTSNGQLSVKVTRR